MINHRKLEEEVVRRINGFIVGDLTELGWWDDCTPEEFGCVDVGELLDAVEEVASRVSLVMFKAEDVDDD